MTVPRKNEMVTATAVTGKGTTQLHPAFGARRGYSARSNVAPLARAGVFQPLPLWAWAAAGILAFFGLFTENPALTAACAITPLVVASLLWLCVESPVLFLGCAMQWLQVATPVAYSDYYGIPLNEMYRLPQIEQATWLSLLGIVVLSLGIRLSWVGMPYGYDSATEAELQGLDQRRVFMAWMAAEGLATLAGIVAWHVPGLTQLIYAVVIVKWVILFILVYGVFVRDDGYGFMLVAIFIEFVTGFAGFFANFKEVLFMIMLVGLCTRIKLRQRHLAAIAVAVIVAVVASLLWTAVKKPYRSYLNQGTGQQTVSEPVVARLQKFGDLLMGLTAADLNESVEALVLRVSYTEYFARSIAYVPAVVPFERGKLWWGAITHVLQPRLFFPNKTALDDSARLRMYTGVRIKGSEEGTSIGIGYMGESYIDFGPLGMFLPIFLLGLSYGLVYRYFVFSNRSRLLGVAIATAVLFISWQAFATSNVKIFGGLVTQCAVMSVLNWIFGVRIMNWLRADQPDRVRRARRDLIVGSPSRSENASNGVP